MNSDALEGEVLESRAVVATPQLYALAERINLLDHQAVTALTNGLEHAIRAGEALAEAKAIVGHGKWLVWLAENCPAVGRTSAAKYMTIYQGYREGRLAQITTGGNLSVNAVAAALSGPRRGQPAAPPPNAAPDVLDANADEPRAYDERAALVGAAVRAIVSIEKSNALGYRRQHNLMAALGAVMDAIEDDGDWHTAYRALEAFRLATGKALERLAT